MSSQFKEASDTSCKPASTVDAAQLTFEPDFDVEENSASATGVSSDTPQKALEKMTYLCAMHAVDDVQTAAQLGAAWDAAYASKNFDKINQDYEKAIRSAYKQGGADAVDKLFLEVDDNVKSKGMGAMVIPGQPTRIIHAQRAEKGETEDTFELPNHKDFGRMKRLENVAEHSIDLRQPQKFSEFAQPTDFSVNRDLTPFEKKFVDNVMERNLGLKDESKNALEKAFSALAKGDFDILAKMVPYAKQDMYHDGVQKAFIDTLTAIGFKVGMDGEAERSPDGMRQGSLTLVPPNSHDGVRLSYDRPRGWIANETYCVEAVKTTVDMKGNLAVETATSVKDVVKQNCAKVVEDFKKFSTHW